MTRPGSEWCQAEAEGLSGLTGKGDEAPARAGNVFRCDVDLLVEAHQLPVIGMVDESETRFAGERDHGLVGAQRVAEHVLGTERGRAAFEILHQRGGDAVALPAIVDRQAELECGGFGMEGVARLGDDGLEAVDHLGRHNGKALARSDIEEFAQQALRQFADRTERSGCSGSGSRASGNSVEAPRCRAARRSGC
jgi:hypothetical protein